MIEIKEQQFIEDFRKQESKLLERVPNHTSERPFIRFWVNLDNCLVIAVYTKEQKRFTAIEYAIGGIEHKIPL